VLVTGERIYDLHVWTCRLQRTWHGAITYEKRKGWDTNQIPTQKDASSNTHHLAFNVYFTTGPPMFWVSKFWEAMIHGWRHQNQSHPASLSNRAPAWMFTERFPKRSAYWERPTDHILRLMGIAQYDLQYSRNPCPSQVAMCCNVWNIHKKSIPRGPRDAKGLEEVSTCFIPRESVPFFFKRFRLRLHFLAPLHPPRPPGPHLSGAWLPHLEPAWAWWGHLRSLFWDFMGFLWCWYTELVALLHPQSYWMLLRQDMGL
jgi:hypothetical protein